MDRLRPGGWFLNADLVVAEDPAIEARIQQIRVEAIVDRARGADPRFQSADSTRAFLDRLEAGEQDRPLPLREDLDVLTESGLRGASVFWLEYREMVSGGWKDAGSPEKESA